MYAHLCASVCVCVSESVCLCVCVCRLSLHVRCAFLTMRFLGQKRNHVCFVVAAAAEATHTRTHSYAHRHTRTGRLINEFSFSLGLAAGSRQQAATLATRQPQQSAASGSQKLCQSFWRQQQQLAHLIFNLCRSHACVYIHTHIFYIMLLQHMSVSVPWPRSLSLSVSLCLLCWPQHKFTSN